MSPSSAARAPIRCTTRSWSPSRRARSPTTTATRPASSSSTPCACAWRRSVLGASSALPVDPARYLAFLGAMAILAATPGPSNLFAVANGMSRGRKAVLLGVAGMNTATVIWYVAAALGLGALALAFPQAVKALIVIGALYLVWLAIKSVKAAFAEHGSLGHATVQPGRSAYWDSFL